MKTNDNDSPAFYRLATRYLVGEASSQERNHMVQMLREPEHQHLFEAMQAEFEGTAPVGDHDFGLEETCRHLAKLTANDCQMQPSAPAHQQPNWRTWMLAACAVVSASLVIFSVLSPEKSPSSISQTTEWITYSTDSSNQLHMTLYDGSHVILNTDSRISLPKSFDGKTRIVRLTGEAYFDVNADPSRVFIVETPTLTVTVLGTRFNVRSFDDGSQSKVSLLSGKVTISGNDTSGEIAPVEMTPGLQYSLDPKDRSGKIQPVDVSNAIQWTKAQPNASASRKNSLIFDQEPLASVLPKLEARFGGVFEMNDVTLAQKTITAHFETESLEEILAILHLAGAFEYEVIRSADKITTVNLWSNRLPDTNGL